MRVSVGVSSSGPTCVQALGNFKPYVAVITLILAPLWQFNTWFLGKVSDASTAAIPVDPVLHMIVDALRKNKNFFYQM